MLDDSTLRMTAQGLALPSDLKRLPQDLTARYLAITREAATRALGLRPIFHRLGVSVDWIGQHTPQHDRRLAYARDVIYAPVSEIGFDVLRDRFAVTPQERVSPVFDVALVDEADTVMIDEAMIPLVLAGSADHAAEEFEAATTLVEALVLNADFTIDADQDTVSFTDAGLDGIEEKLGSINLCDSEHLGMLTRINLALHARALVHRDVDYLVIDGKLTLINTTRGRVAHLQRWPDGLHAAILAEVKARGTQCWWERRASLSPKRSPVTLRKQPSSRTRSRHRRSRCHRDAQISFAQARRPAAWANRAIAAQRAATWTYLVADDPYWSPGDRFVRRIGTLVRSRILNLE